MDIFTFEFLHFIVAIFALLVSVSASTLFYNAFRREHHSLLIIRSLGFIALAVAFALFVFERKFPGLALTAVVVEFIGFFAIALGVIAAPKLSQLLKVKIVESKKKVTDIASELNQAAKILIGFFVVVLVALVIFLASDNLQPFAETLIVLLSLVFIIFTIFFQVKRYQDQRDNPKFRRINLYPLIGYLFLIPRQLLLAFHRLPESDLVAVRLQTLDNSAVWIWALVFTALAFFFLALWAWTFIRIRFIVRTYVLLLILLTIVATLGSLVFTFLLFRFIEANNLNTLQQAVNSELLVMEDRSRNAKSLALNLAENPRITENLNNPDSLRTILNMFYDESNVDLLRIYNADKKLIVAVNDNRDEGSVVNDDPFLNRAFEIKSLVRTFDNEPGVLTDIIVTRAINPVLSNGNVAGVIEVGYKFENAFVDLSKSRTGLDVTVFNGNLRSATTLLTQDDVSRWVGSEEEDQEVLDVVLGQNREVKKVVDRLGRIYYSAFEPIVNADGTVIGMVSFESLKDMLFEDTRQQLLSIFIITSGTALIAAVVGYSAFKYFEELDAELA